MKKEDIKNKRHERREVEEKFTLEQVQSLAALITAGVLCVGGKEYAEEAEKLPLSLKKVLIATILTGRDYVQSQIPSALASILAKQTDQGSTNSGIKC